MKGRDLCERLFVVGRRYIPYSPGNSAFVLLALAAVELDGGIAENVGKESSGDSIDEYRLYRIFLLHSIYQSVSHG